MDELSKNEVIDLIAKFKKIVELFLSGQWNMYASSYYSFS